MSIECTNKANNKVECSCKKSDCANHGICCECVANHRQKGNYPACLRYQDK